MFFLLVLAANFTSEISPCFLLYIKQTKDGKVHMIQGIQDWNGIDIKMYFEELQSQ